MKFSLQTLVAAVTVSSTSAMWGYWVPPLDEPGVSCEHKRIKIPDHGEYTCMTVGTGICRDNGGYFGEWRFGVNDFKESPGACLETPGKIVPSFNEGVMSCFTPCSLRMRKKMFIVPASVTYSCLSYTNSD